MAQNAKLYRDFTVAPYAVADYVGTTLWATNNLRGDKVDSMSDHMVNSEIKRSVSGDNMEEVQVNVTTVDAFVKENNLPRVDFIKADIEGAERLMLKGATETLKACAPKLSLCTYHLPDDPEVLEKLILEANPNYVIVQKTYKLYAYVPK